MIRRLDALWCMLVILMAASAGVAVAQDTPSDASGARLIGKVISADTGDPLPYANVVVYRVESLTDTTGVAIGGGMSAQDGSYRITVPSGYYRLLVGYVGFNQRKVFGVEAHLGQTTTVDIALSATTAMKLQTVEVTATANRATEASVLIQQKRSAAVSDGVSSQQIKKTPDSNAADVLRRVTGLSVVGGRYLYVRGLGERYSATQVNGASVGTPEPNKRVVPLDLFAAGLIENIVVQKTYTPDQPGEFGGGVVNIRTKDFPGEKVWDVNLSTGLNSATAGENFLSYDGGGTDFLGIDDGTRALPDLVTRLAGHQKVVGRSFLGDGFSADTLGLLGDAFSDTWGARRKTSKPNLGGSLTAGNEIDFMGRKLGIIGSLSLSNGSSTRRSEEWTYEGGADAIKSKEKVRTSEASTLWGGILNTGYRVTPYHTFNLRTMYNRSAENEVRFSEALIDADEGRPVQSTRLRYVERGLWASTLGMNHTLKKLDDLAVDWRIGYSRADRDEPDRRRIRYALYPVMDEDDNVIGSEWRLARSSPTRWFGNTNEDDRSVEANASYGFHQWSRLDSKIKIGVSLRNKDRDSRWRRFTFTAPGNLGGARDSILALPADRLMDKERVGGNSGSQFVIREETQPTDSYQAHQDVNAFYGMIDLPLAPRWRSVFGARVENSTIDNRTYDMFGLTADIDAHRKNHDILPSLNLTFSPDENTNLRAAASVTVSRPDLREFSKTRMTDSEDENYQQVGNPDLERARIHNYDLRLERYPSAAELVAVSAFLKHFDRPIEQAVQIDDQPVYKPLNGKSGLLRGVELESRLGLERVSPRLAAWSGSANVTIVHSEVRLDESTGVQATNERPLGGQSPYVLNFGLYYVSGSGRTNASLLFNRFGKRLYRVGLLELPDIYEEARSALDLTATRALGSYRLKLAFSNILDGEAKFNQADAPTKRWKRGRGLSVAISTGS